MEYVVSDRKFETLPPEEQKLWHSHAYEVLELYLTFDFLILLFFL